LLSEGIGDTIRVSLTAPPVQEVKTGQRILESLESQIVPTLIEHALNITGPPAPPPNRQP